MNVKCLNRHLVKKVAKLGIKGFIQGKTHMNVIIAKKPPLIVQSLVVVKLLFQKMSRKRYMRRRVKLIFVFLLTMHTPP